MKAYLSSALLLVIASRLSAQIGVPAMPTTDMPAAAPAALVAPVAAAAPKNIWSCLCMSPEQATACKLKFCSCPLGQLLNSGLQPMSLMSGGMIGGCCPPAGLNPAALAAPPTSATGAAARIQQSEADAKARRAAVRYLGTVDCNRWPEAEVALITALRCDTNECVRWEAARSLGNGCCCTRKIIESLTLTVSGSTKDGNPVETSPRVKAAACAALDHCLACFVDPMPNELPRPEAPPPVRPETPWTPPTPQPREVSPISQAALVANARSALAQAANRPQAGTIPTGQRDLYHLLTKAKAPNTNAVAAAEYRQTAPPPLAATPTTGTRLPPSGQRDLFHIVTHTFRPPSAN